MTTGLAATTLANKWLDMLGGTAFTAPVAAFAEPHTADPGAAGTTSVFTTVTTQRSAITYAAASAGSKSQTGSAPTWAVTGSGTVSHIAVFDASSAGNFLFSAAVTTPKAVTNGDTLNLTSLSISFTPIAA
jgi:hypothetical protein